MTDQKHSPLPWTLERPCGFPYTGLYIVESESTRTKIDYEHSYPFHIAKIRLVRNSQEGEANAELIVRSVNSLPGLVELIKAVLDDSKKSRFSWEKWDKAAGQALVDAGVKP